MDYLSAERRVLRIRDGPMRRVCGEEGPTQGSQACQEPVLQGYIRQGEVETTLNPWMEEDVAKAIEETEKDDCEWFKLECSKRLTSL